ncbi:NAD-glutamate dehydrogenase [Rhodococcus triatomae]|uniref:Glutamate dehydrogenase n=1 Tax=Rhodococcus triatomae TaxID=300028 RepID=A0A1G8DUY3_9NOCA|nr:NAD-glutamate dehydrogenase [Rhodococcus triatomae]QNG18342.1 NAD-glutamate dehydrogenase [Rhodococcus triatomae]QNG21988.1 NAD-glutamate dehydrogenase [Rhodococcus triatomae]SDH61425.1 glutamate dehydrogenase [Rhodococcus triatomae]
MAEPDDAPDPHGAGDLAPSSDALASLLPNALRDKARPLWAKYFAHADRGDSDSRTAAPEDVLAAHLELARVRRPGAVSVRVHRPGTGLGACIQVVVDDMPLLIESLVALVNRLGIGVSELIHPIFTVRRDDAGTLVDVGFDSDAATVGGAAESWIHVQLDPHTDAATLDALESRVPRVLDDVGVVVRDTDALRATENAVADELLAGAPHPAVTPQHLDDVARLLRWMASSNYSALGYRRLEMRPQGEAGARTLQIVPGSGLGVMRTDTALDDRILGMSDTLGDDRRLLVLTQGTYPATVHRDTYPYFVGVRILDRDGEVIGEHRFLGVFTVTAMHQNVLEIPLIERRVRDVIARSGYELNSYSGQTMLEVIESFPRAELFSSSTDLLFDTVSAVHSVGLRRRVRLFVRVDDFGRFVSCLVYLPRDRYTTAVRRAMQDILRHEFGGGDLEYSARVTDSDLALLHVTIRNDPPRPPHTLEVSEAERERIEARLTAVSRSWEDRLDELLDAHPDFDTAGVRQFVEALPDAYKEDFDAARAARDAVRVARLAPDGIDVSLYRTPAGRWRFALYVDGASVSLGRVLPLVQSLGVEVDDERPYGLRRDGEIYCWIYDFGLSVPADLAAVEIDETAVGRFTDAFEAMWRGRAAVDRFNELVLRAGMTWRQAVILRAYTKYLRQVTFPYSQYHIEGVAIEHPRTARMLVELFEATFDPDLDAPERVTDLHEGVAERIGAVVGLDADRILRALAGLVRATLRTNYFVRDTQGNPLDRLSLKFDPRAIDELPRPAPMFEIFVYAPDLEGVHLRFGSVARGGLRWSDRREDYRTEILGLAKAQEVKNAVIVPAGAKGGFVVKNPPTPTGDDAADRRAYAEEGARCYRAFVSGLLDVTDDIDLVSGDVVPPPRVIRRDGDDTYLVVAADKGTATFSDLANSLAAEYGYWLGDAFASGGSTGYDHKELGITARGAWVSVQRHFRELGIDADRAEITVAGVGDMSGDVFGNGMLLSAHLRLVAAFDHRHIFLDPDPDPAPSYAERRRLFELPRSTWADYDRSLIAEGGGVWERSLKSVPVGPAVREALGLDETVTQLSPPELIRAILRAPVDLLWNGGIGTYVKASSETDGDVGDKGNDAVRVNGDELRARVVGEGGNLGITPLGRVEYSLAGGRINTDALDNSAGVDSSDHEVNLKVLLDSAVGRGELAVAERNPLLADMSDEVAELVLDDNRGQNALMGVSRASAPQTADVHRRLIDHLVADRGLDRELEALPSDAEIVRRKDEGGGLVSPELATLMAHVKLALEDELLATGLPDSSTFAPRLPRYFPARLRARFADQIEAHPLRRQLVATMLANQAVEGGGITYVYRLREDAGASGTDAIRAYAIVTEIFGLPDLWELVRSAGLSAAVEDALVLETGRLLDRASRWFLAHRPQPLAVGAEISRYRDHVRALLPLLPTLMLPEQQDDLLRRARPLVDAGAPGHLTLDVFRRLHGFAFLDICDIADIAERETTEVADLYFALDEHLHIGSLLTSVSELPRGDRWNSLARLALRDDFYSSLRQLTFEVLADGEPGETSREKIGDWESINASRIARARSALRDIGESGTLDLATLTVAARQVRSMVRAGGTRSEV